MLIPLKFNSYPRITRIVGFVLYLFAGCTCLGESSDILQRDAFAENLNAIKTALSEKNEVGQLFEAKVESLFDHADELLDLKNPSVTQKRHPAPSGDPHDYCSLAPYWWPDPEQPDGLPYIRKDGEICPEYFSDDSSDVRRLQLMANAVSSLSLAYAFSQDERYAVKAVELLRGWFIDPETRMNPNLDYAQGVRGRSDGRCFGIIETVRMTRLPLAISLLRASPACDQELMEALVQWFGDYLFWLQTSEFGLQEATRANNHGTWYDVQVVTFAAFVGRNDVVRNVLKSVAENRLLSQILMDGQQPHELARTKSLSYSLMNLRAFLLLANYAKCSGIDFFSTGNASGKRLRAAVEFLMPHANDPSQWPRKQLTVIEPKKFLDIILPASRLYKDFEWREFVPDMHLPEALTLEQIILYYDLFDW